MSRLIRFCLLSTVLTLAGCGFFRAYPTPSTAPWADKVHYTGSAIEVSALSQTTAADGSLRVVVQLRSTSMFEQHLLHRALWFDANGAPLATIQNKWQERRLAAGQLLELSYVAPSAAAHDFRLEFTKK